MNIEAPHYLLFAETLNGSQQGDWRFVLQATSGGEDLTAEDHEPQIRGERLELLTVIRGLEALDQPSRITLTTSSRYVNRGIARGLPAWRENDWTWEYHGRMVPVKDSDLWQRLDRALKYHQLNCRRWRIDPTHHQPAPAEQPPAPADREPPPAVRSGSRRNRLRLRRTVVQSAETLRLRIAQFGTFLLPRPWIG